MITKNNYVVEAKKIDFSKLPSQFAEGHDLTNDAVELYDDLDKGTKDVIDAYVASLNAELGKAKPAAKKKAAPAKAPARKKIATVKKAKAKQPSASATKTKLDALKTKTANEPGLKSWSRVQVLKRAAQFQELRGKRSERDMKTGSKKRLTPNPENLLRWMNAPGSFDLIGMDNADKKSPTANLKMKKESWWKKIGIHYKG